MQTNSVNDYKKLNGVALVFCACDKIVKRKEKMKLRTFSYNYCIINIRYQPSNKISFTSRTVLQNMTVRASRLPIRTSRVLTATTCDHLYVIA
jgi:hypothetical protein